MAGVEWVAAVDDLACASSAFRCCELTLSPQSENPLASSEQAGSDP